MRVTKYQLHIIKIVRVKKNSSATRNKKYRTETTEVSNLLERFKNNHDTGFLPNAQHFPSSFMLPMSCCGKVHFCRCHGTVSLQYSICIEAWPRVSFSNISRDPTVVFETLEVLQNLNNSLSPSSLKFVLCFDM